MARTVCFGNILSVNMLRADNNLCKYYSTKWTYWYQNGSKRKEGEYIYWKDNFSSDMIGLWSYWNNKGTKVKEVRFSKTSFNYVNGKKLSTVKYPEYDPLNDPDVKDEEETRLLPPVF